jgi:uncharacterized protein YggU (UPF0235/DUF167 family)
MRVIQVKAKPSSRESTVEELEDGSFLVKLKAQPVEVRPMQSSLLYLPSTSRCRAPRSRSSLEPGPAPSWSALTTHESNLG